MGEVRNMVKAREKVKLMSRWTQVLVWIWSGREWDIKCFPLFYFLASFDKLTFLL